MSEHMKAGSIYQVDFDALPLGKGDGVLHGDAAGYLFFVIGGYGRAVFYAALGGGHLCGMQQSGNYGGFTAVRMPHYSYVADLTSLVGFHGVLLGYCETGLAMGREGTETQVLRQRFVSLRMTVQG
jgi:hypothetical protein